MEQAITNDLISDARIELQEALHELDNGVVVIALDLAVRAAGKLAEAYYQGPGWFGHGASDLTKLLESKP